MMKTAGAAMLGSLLQGRMQVVSKSPVIADTGTIGGDLSLTTNAFPKPVPVGEYWVCRGATHDPAKPLTETEPNKEGPPPHIHDVKLPEKMYRIKPGDRVLVVWCGSDAVVVDVIYPGTEVV